MLNLPILFNTKMILLVDPLSSIIFSICLVLQPKGSRASNTSKMTSAASRTLRNSL